MSKFQILILKAFRKIYSYFIGVQKPSNLYGIEDAVLANKIIYNLLISDKPCMIGRFGSTELTCLYNHMGVSNNKKNKIDFIRGISPPYWWEDSIMKQMQNWSGFFPPTEDKIAEFCNLMLKDIPQLDVLGSWLSLEDSFARYFNATKIHLRLLEPFWNSNPWTMALEGKKILVVHPFDDIINFQYQKRGLLFENKNTLPSFESLTTIKAIQSLGEADDRFLDWFEALDHMKEEINCVDFDICLIGAGAYGFPLAAHVKRMGKKAVHLGGSLQLLFGIIGKRWEDPNYGVKEWGIPKGTYSNLINEFWVRPGNNNKPKNAEQVEGACYW